MTELAQSLLRCKVEGNTLHLPPMSDGALANYSDVRKALLNAGATYKKNTFVFPSDAQPFIDRLTDGESVNIKKEFQFFATPAKLADRLVELAELNEHDGRGFGSILEPSAGQGAIVKAIHEATGGTSVIGYELMDVNRQILKKIKGLNIIGEDFLQADESNKYDYIIANPPFSKNQDIDHIRKMYAVCENGGRIVTIASRHWIHAKNKKETAFREWLHDIDARIIEVDAGEFKESGTAISSVIIIIDK
jgi:predicted RNA methylase